MQAERAENSWLRYRADGGAVFTRLARHPVLAPARRCLSIRSADPEVGAVLERAAAYVPFFRSELEVHAVSGSHEAQPGWLGLQRENALFLFNPAYQNVSTLVFTFFHEYAHWVQKQEALLSDEDWDEYLGDTEDEALRDEGDLLRVWEAFADDFAWFSTNPIFSSLRRPRAYRFFMRWVTRRGEKRERE